ncbi:hypothetical protein K3495_g4350 [Podosphaera aphanis]|nr:hypothetical protein K3495_g4350 [Podosphaera aphanis]
MKDLNPLISTQSARESSYDIALHPLVLLTISDYITRHTLRQQKGPVVGALMGQQNGREITIEHAFECLVSEVDGQIILNQSWFDERLTQMKDVHKAPQLDLVGWYTLLPASGPQPAHLPIHGQIMQLYNHSALLLGFHPSLIETSSSGGKLPLTLYESKLESDEITGTQDEDRKMEDGEPNLSLKFKELAYTVETGDAEMISIDFVARGGGNATAVESSENKSGSHPPGEERVFSREDEELLASLTTKLNAVKMLHARIKVLAIYLNQLLKCQDSKEVTEDSKWVDHSILRSIQALLSRHSLLVPDDMSEFEHELIAEQNDVNLVSLLSSLTDSIKSIRQAGFKHRVVESTKTNTKKLNHPFNVSAYQTVGGAGDLLP